MENKSGIIPRGHRVLILPAEVEHKTESGIIISTGSERKREEMAQIDGIVVAMGNTCYSDQPEPWCGVGDQVIFGKYSGLLYKGNDGKEYRILNDLDVVAFREEVK
jgi:co-chaperonin GroES (HSP10)